MLCSYPKTRGEDYLYEALLDFIHHHFNLLLDPKAIIPTLGTREVLFSFPQFFLSQFQNPIMAYPNPFYQIYEGSSIASRAQTFLMELKRENSFKPSLSKEQMQACHLVILNSPNNPTGSTLTLDELKQWVADALKYDFVVLNDECYNQIYQENPPASILEASMAVGNKDFKNVLCINSLSKTISAPGLRGGFIAGDAEILQSYLTYRTYAGVAIPNPLQKAASIAWRSYEQAEEIRQKYARNLKMAQEIFTQTTIFPFSFYVWLYVGDELSFCKRLYEEEGILVLPGSFLGRNGAGCGYVRIALVYDEEILKPLLESINHFLHKGNF